MTSVLLPKLLSARFFFKTGNRCKSLGVRSRPYGGWCGRSQRSVAIWFCIAVAECGLALTSNNRTPDLRSPGHFFPNHLFQFRQGVTVSRSIAGSNLQKS
ncbi:hypothetical protein TNCV_3588021 [Trichonephila clavipes]|nr:hypothetical protein TNCV_3588021 [Trichonephila clavipes]